MNQRLEEQLRQLFLKMTSGSARKKIYALRAKQEGQTELADLFSAISSSEAAQAARILVQLRGQTGSNAQNSVQAFEQELPTTIEAYEKTAQHWQVTVRTRPCTAPAPCLPGYSECI